MGNMLPVGNKAEVLGSVSASIAQEAMWATPAATAVDKLLQPASQGARLGGAKAATAAIREAGAIGRAVEAESSWPSVGRVVAAMTACQSTASAEYAEAVSAARWHLQQQPAAAVGGLCPQLLARVSQTKPGKQHASARKRALHSLRLVAAEARPQFVEYCVAQLKPGADKRVQLAVAVAVEKLAARADDAHDNAVVAGGLPSLGGASEPEPQSDPDGGDPGAWLPVHKTLMSLLREAGGGSAPTRLLTAALDCSLRILAACGRSEGWAATCQTSMQAIVPAAVAWFEPPAGELLTRLVAAAEGKIHRVGPSFGRT